MFINMTCEYEGGDHILDKDKINYWEFEAGNDLFQNQWKKKKKKKKEPVRMPVWLDLSDWANKVRVTVGQSTKWFKVPNKDLGFSSK